jgi:hypothetical protein
MPEICRPDTTLAPRFKEQLDSGFPGPVGTLGIGIISLEFLGYARGLGGGKPWNELHFCSWQL